MGRFTQTEKEYIIAHATDMTPQQMSTTLSISNDKISRFLRHSGLFFKGEQKGRRSRNNGKVVCKPPISCLNYPYDECINDRVPNADEIQWNNPDAEMYKMNVIKPNINAFLPCRVTRWKPIYIP